jgi:hypothetical protein
VETKMIDRRSGVRARSLLPMLAAMLLLAACGGRGVTGPCDDSDPVGPCATSHSQTHGGG